MWRIFAGIVVLLGACTPVDYDAVTKGSFEGVVRLYWISGGAGSAVGDGKFLYYEDELQPLRFLRDDANAPSGESGVITPNSFFTDGGSVPRVVQSVPGFNA
ncbi:hypothetical protein [Shimia isoporae]|uniref:hypothetical protein n=1 Tax=Shimia isoporae TaxID=647720 RepID=UPI001047D12C|nr:hypothetical protein [Shimia isoporae]